MYNAVSSTRTARPISTCAKHVANAPPEATFTMIKSLLIDLFKDINYVSECMFTQFTTSHFLNEWPS